MCLDFSKTLYGLAPSRLMERLTLPDQAESVENCAVSVIMLTRDSLRTLSSCLNSVIRQHPREIIAVDGGSQDGTLDILKDYGVLVILDPSMSLGHSRQMGVKAASGDYVMFVDSDVELTRDCIGQMRHELERFGWAGIHAQMMSRENLSYWQRSEDVRFSLHFNKVGPIDCIPTTAALFRRSILLEHPFDSSFAESAEDVDLCWSLGRNKLRVGVSSAAAYHTYRRSFLSFFQQRFRNGKGSARLALKCRSTLMLLSPLENMTSQCMRSIFAGRPNLVPYWIVYGVAEFSGVLALLSRRRHQGQSQIKVKHR